MKANKTPEKVFIRPTAFEYPCPSYIDENSNYGGIEYIRTDAFIEKACEWLKTNARDYAFVDTDRIGNVADIDLELVQDFRKYMKGE